MSIKFENLLEENYNNLLLLASQKESFKEICEALGYSANGRYTKAVRLFFNIKNIDYSHFRLSGNYKKLVSVTCPQCNNNFLKNLNSAKDSRKVTCSHACGNKYFKQIQQEGRHKGLGFAYEKNYVLLLSNHLQKLNIHKECVVCGYTKVLDCHHIDGDRENNEINNLVFLCPNHHADIHRNNCEDVFDSIVKHLDSRDFITQNIALNC